MFVDKVKIEVKAGNGGNGAVAFRREKYVPNGGPAGGDGGKGGDIIFKADTNLSTLLDLRYQKKYKAKDGENGMPKRMNGKSASSLIIRVPVGTIVYEEETGKVIADITKADQEAIVAKAGRGGRGNCHFATSRNPAPELSENGEPGELKNLVVELKLLADVGLVGFPSVGKSTLLSVVSKAKPEIAAYPFTTIVPNLGVVQTKDQERSFVMADLPGLIAGASLGKGLGHQFLRHIERCRVIVHVVDMVSLEQRDPYEDYVTINSELESYQYNLMKRPQIIVANKMDMPDAKEKLEKFKAQLDPEIKVFEISAITREGIDQLIYHIADLLDANPITDFEDIIEESTVLYTFEKEEDPFVIENKGNGLFIVTGKQIENLVARTNFKTEDSIKRFARILRNMGVDEALRKNGANNGDTIRIDDFEFEFVE